MRKAAAVNVAGVEIEDLDVVLDLSLIAVDHAERVGREHRQLVVGEVDDLIGAAGQGRGVAGHEMLAGAHADDQRASQPRGQQHLRIVAKEDHQPVGPLQLGQRPCTAATSGW